MVESNRMEQKETEQKETEQEPEYSNSGEQETFENADEISEERIGQDEEGFDELINRLSNEPLDDDLFTIEYSDSDESTEHLSEDEIIQIKVRTVLLFHALIIRNLLNRYVHDYSKLRRSNVEEDDDEEAPDKETEVVINEDEWDIYVGESADSDNKEEEKEEVDSNDSDDEDEVLGPIDVFDDRGMLISDEYLISAMKMDERSIEEKRGILCKVRHYLHSIEISDGFECRHFPGRILGLTTLEPQNGVVRNREKNHQAYKRFMFLAFQAIGHYNLYLHEGNVDPYYEVLELVKVFVNMPQGLEICITFRARDATTGDTKVFQAKVWDDRLDNKFDVLNVRPVREPK